MAKVSNMTVNLKVNLPSACVNCDSRFNSTGTPQCGRCQGAWNWATRALIEDLEAETMNNPHNHKATLGDCSTKLLTFIAEAQVSRNGTRAQQGARELLRRRQAQPEREPSLHVDSAADLEQLKRTLDEGSPFDG